MRYMVKMSLSEKQNKKCLELRTCALGLKRENTVTDAETYVS